MARISMKWIDFFLRLILAGVFVYAGTLKALDPAQFVRSVDNYRLFPYWWTAPVALYLPWLEITLGLCLLWPRTCAGASFLALGVTLLFLLVLASAWIRHLDITCGCFGKGSVATVKTALYRDLLLVIVAAWIVRTRSRIITTKEAGALGFELGKRR